MANNDKVKDLKSTIEHLKSVEKEKLLRTSLGEESLESLTPKYNVLLEKADFALEYAIGVSDNFVSQANNTFHQIYQLLDQQAKRNNVDYVTQKQNFLNSLDNSFEQINTFWPFFVTAAVEARGFLQDEGIRKEYQKTVTALEEKANNTLQQLQEQAAKSINEAKELAKSIEERARQTATHISVKDAQEQFKIAQADYDKQVKIWGVLSGITIFAFIALAFYLEKSDVPKDGTATVIYYTAVRLTALTALGAVATFCLRILRAHMHMKQLNMHRQRVANSISSFVQSAITPEQRDMILMHLVDSVIQFGQSGLLVDGDDSVTPAKLAIDTVTRNVTSVNK